MIPKREKRFLFAGSAREEKIVLFGKLFIF